MQKLFQRLLKRRTANADPTSAPASATVAPAAPLPLPETVPDKARHHPDPAERLAAIEQLDDPQILAECAMQDALASHRARALERLDDKAALERVARQIGKKDKRVYRLAREKLRLIAEREERPRIVRERCDDLCAQLERLGRLANWHQDRALLDHLERQWQHIQAEVTPDDQHRFDRERTRFLDAYAAHLAQQAQAQAQRQADAEAETRAAALQPPPAVEPVAVAEPPAPAAPAAAAEAPTAPAPEPIAAPAPPPDPSETRKRLEKTSQQLQALLNASKPLDHKQAQRLLDQGRTLAARLLDADAGTDADAETETAAPTFPPLAARVEARLRSQRKHAEQRLQQFPERFSELEAHLADGELKLADPLYQSLLAALELIQASGIDPQQATRWQQRLRTLTPRLRELQNWRRWGADQHRELLCSEMEALLTAEALSPAACAERLHQLQMDWKGLDKTGSPANQALWERFHAISEQVYARCRPFLEAQAAEREQNRLAREQLCAQLEAFVAQVDWERIDWKKTLHAEREMRQAWAALGPTEGRVRKALERRFHQSLRLLDRQLDAERQHNQALKRDLIAQVQALSDWPDLDAAIEYAKRLQREWHTTVPARQKDENRLWRDFRAACDAIFERRAARHQAHAQDIAEQLAVREALCHEAEQVCATSDMLDLQTFTQLQRELLARWREAEAQPLPRQAAATITRRWQSCRDALDQQRHALEQRQRLTALERLAQQAAFCERLEQALLVGDGKGLDPDDLRREWAALPTPDDAALQRAITARSERALAAISDAAALDHLRQACVANGERRAVLCLQLEIASGVETPPEFAQQRLELQVARLAERLSEGEADSLQNALRLLDDWYLLGPVPADAGLDARFARVREVVLG